jgi:pre-rRNA-processing protein TSR1
VHIPDFGDFQIERILDASIQRKDQMSLDEPVVLQIPELEKRDSLIEQNEIDPMDAEQTWPTDEELAEAEGN